MLTLRKPTKMDARFGKTYLNHLEMLDLQLEGSLSPFDGSLSLKDQEKQLEIGKMIDGVKKKLAECLSQRRRANHCKLCESLSCDGRQLDELLKTRPSMDLCEPEDFILYWYVHGEFPEDMCLDDIQKTQLAAQGQLNWVIYLDDPDKAYAAYCRAKAEVQLQQLQDMLKACWEALEDEDEEGGDDLIDWQGEDTDDLMEWQDDEAEESSECPEGWPIYLAFIPEEPEHPEDMTIPELGFEIEKQEYNLLCLKSAENGEEGTEKPCLWQQSVDSVNALLAKLRGILRQRLLEALGEEEDASIPMEYQDGEPLILYTGVELKRAEDIVGAWYLHDHFPIMSWSGEKLLQVEAELKRQQAELELNEPEDEAEHALWQFCWDQRAEQLDEIQTMQWNQATDGEEWDPEDE